MTAKIEPLAPKHILIVEDEIEANLFMERALQLEGYRTTGVFSGGDALVRIESTAYDLILLDIMMRDLNGIETCRRIRSHDKGASTPVCMITASVDVEKVVASFAAGANGYIVKPFELDELFNKVRELTGAIENA